MKRKNKFTIDKYNNGSYVITNQQTPYKDIKGPSFGGSALSGASTGAYMGSSLGPMGMIGGAVIGAVGGLFGASNKERKARHQRLNIRNQFINNFEDQYEGNIDSVNETPYGTYEKGGDIHINPKNKGKFTSWAKSKGMGVQEAASKVLANKDDYSSTIVKRANFAKNAAKWNRHEDGGQVLPSITPINIEKG